VKNIGDLNRNYESKLMKIRLKRYLLVQNVGQPLYSSDKQFDIFSQLLSTFHFNVIHGHLLFRLLQI